MSFHFGKPILVMLVISLVSGSAVLFRRGEPKKDITIWVFADSHFQAYQRLIPAFEKEHHLSVDMKLVQVRATNIRLASSFMSGSGAEEMPDLVEIEIGSIGKYFRPPLKDVGLLDLTDRLKESGWYDRMVKSRFAPWSKEGRIFGVPHDIHPTTISYREDLFREAGIDLSQAKTWPAFQEACLKFQDYWRAKGYPQRHAIQLPAATSDYLTVMLLQRGVNLIDDRNEVHLEDEKVAQTMAFYAQLVAGPRRIGGESTGGTGAFVRDIREGNLCAFLTPDWQVTYLRMYADESLRGKMRMMPLPVFDEGDAPTATWGGTMIGIPRTCPNPDRAWLLLQHLYFSREGIEKRRQETDILPPVRDYWKEDYYHHEDYWYEEQAKKREQETGEKSAKLALFGPQKATEMFIELAEKIPPRYVMPATSIATGNLTYAMNKAVDYVRSHGNADGLEAKCREWLKAEAKDLRKRMDQWKFDE
jgi:arabinosaccharide transport system substrate-binding protein